MDSFAIGYATRAIHKFKLYKFIEALSELNLIFWHENCQLIIDCNHWNGRSIEKICMQNMVKNIENLFSTNLFIQSESTEKKHRQWLIAIISRLVDSKPVNSWWWWWKGPLSLQEDFRWNGNWIYSRVDRFSFPSAKSQFIARFYGGNHWFPLKRNINPMFYEKRYSTPKLQPKPV